MQLFRRFVIPALCTAGVLALSACGHTESDRVTGGAATGAATGAVVGALGGPVGVGAGALIGAAAGAGTGLVASPNKVNLGTPPWHQFDQRVAQQGVGSQRG
jgi:hypothetical protein